MGRSKHRFSAGRAAKKTASKPTMSKRSKSKGVQRKAASIERKAALVGRLSSESKAKAYAKKSAANPFMADSLAEVLDEIASAPSPASAKTNSKRKSIPKGKTNKSKQYIVHQETARIRAVLDNPAFQANPVDAILRHLQATMSGGPSEAPRR